MVERGLIKYSFSELRTKHRQCEQTLIHVTESGQLNNELMQAPCGISLL